MRKFHIKIYQVRKISLYALISVVILACSYQTAYGRKERATKVRRVIDGDTVELEDGTRVRYLGIDAPETRRKVGNKWVYQPERFAKDAVDLNRRLVSGKMVNIETDKDVMDKYGRILAYIYTEEGLLVNEELLKRGVATVFILMPNTKHYERFLKASEQAKVERVGLWSESRLISPKEAASQIGKVCSVKGKVMSARETARGVILRLSDTEKYVFDVIVPSGNVILFREKGIDPVKKYSGGDIAVTGKIRAANVPYIIADIPEKINFDSR